MNANTPTSKLIEKIAKLKRKPVRIVGYLGAGPSKSTVHLYPQIDPGCYFVIPKVCIIEVLPGAGDKNDRVTLLLDAMCEIECVVREHKRAGELDCGEKHKSPCGCKPPETGTSAMKTQSYYIWMARWLLALGINHLDCSEYKVLVSPQGCCLAWNELLRALQGGATGELEAQALVEGSC